MTFFLTTCVLVASIASSSQTTSADILASIEQRLGDPNRVTRSVAMSDLSQLIQQRKVQNSDHLPDPRSRPSLIAAIVRALDDEDSRIRGGAIRALTDIDSPLHAKIGTALIARFDREPDEEIRAFIVERLGWHDAVSRVTQQFITKSLDDFSSRVRRRAAFHVAKFRPTSALPRIVRELESGDPEARAEFIYALAAYGPAAKPHLSVLQRLRSFETDEARRFQIDKAIQTVSSAR